MSRFGALSSALSLEGADSSSMLSSLLSMVTIAQNTNTPREKIPVQKSSELTSDQQTDKSQNIKNSSPLTSMLMSMSRSQNLGQGESEGQGGMFAMLQNICGKVSQLREAEHAGAESLPGDHTDRRESR